MDGSADPLAGARLPRRLRDLLFEEDFGLPFAPPPPPPNDPEPEVIAPGPPDAALMAARAEAWAEGYAAGKAEVEAAGARALGDLAASLAAAIGTAAKTMRDEAQAAAEALAQLLMEMFATLFPDLCKRHGPSEALALVRALLPALSQEPSLDVTISPALVPKVQEEIARALPESQRARVRVGTEPFMKPGDVRVSWRTGAARRDAASLWESVEAVLAPAGLLRVTPQRETVDVD